MVLLWGFKQTGNWMPKTNLAGKKKIIWREQKVWQERRIGALAKTIFSGTIWRPDKTTSLYYKVNVGFVHKKWYERRIHTKSERGTEGGRERQRHELKRSWLLEYLQKD